MSPAKIHRLPRRRGGCPICGKPPAAAHAPFCSPRCRDVDLSRWFGGSYAIPAVEPEETEQPPEGGADAPKDED